MTHKLPDLPYQYSALEPHIDAKTMEIHHSKHHATYVNKLNEALAKHPELESKELPELLKDLNKIPEDIRTAVRNHGGGHLNHSFFWKIMTPKSTPPKGKILEAINQKFSSFDKFKEQFTNTATTLFGSGWTWLTVDNKGELKIETTPNQDNPISQGRTAILGLDVWEHAYYIKHQNKRADYIVAWWNVVNWDEVNKLYEESILN